MPEIVRARNTTRKVNAMRIPAAFCTMNELTRAAAATLANDILSALPAVRPSATVEPSAPITSSPPPSEMRGRSHDQMVPDIPTVLVVTALSLEASEVVAYLADVREVEHPATRSLYQVGRFGGPPEFEVAVVVTGAGNESAATETERAIQRFNPSVALFVGVAGGLKEDVVIGDVVAADYVYDYSSAKEGAEFVQARIKTASASYAARQRAQAIASSGSWISLIKRPAPTDEAPDPSAFVKPIAAGSKLLASTNAPTAVWIKQHCGDALAVEMEGYGFHNALSAYTGIQAIVVRGVSDVVDGKSSASDKAWQPVAASRAAAFALTVAAGLVKSPASKRSIK